MSKNRITVMSEDLIVFLEMAPKCITTKTPIKCGRKQSEKVFDVTDKEYWFEGKYTYHDIEKKSYHVRQKAGHGVKESS